MIKRRMKFVLTVSLLLIIVYGNAQDATVTPSEIFHSFKQTDKGNCVPVACIKAAISVFGMDSVFLSIKIDSVKNARGKMRIKSLSVVTLDTTKINLDSTELNQAFTSSHFELLEPENKRYRRIYDLALLWYAVTAKNKIRVDSLREKEKGTNEKGTVKSFKQSLDGLDEGSDTKTAYQYLGLPEKYVKVQNRFSRTKGYTGLVVYNWKHAAFASYGLMDLWGKITRIRKLIFYGRVRIVKPR